MGHPSKEQNECRGGPTSHSQSPYSLAVLSFQHVAVGGDLTIQAGLFIKEGLILAVLTLDVTANFGQLGLHVADQALELGELGAVARLGLLQSTFQSTFLGVGGSKRLGQGRLPSPTKQSELQGL